MSAKRYKLHWKKDQDYLNTLTYEIMKDLEYNYRLPENIVTLLLKSVKRTLTGNKSRWRKEDTSSADESSYVNFDKQTLIALDNLATEVFSGESQQHFAKLVDQFKESVKKNAQKTGPYKPAAKNFIPLDKAKQIQLGLEAEKIFSGKDPLQTGKIVAELQESFANILKGNTLLIPQDILNEILDNVKKETEDYMEFLNLKYKDNEQAKIKAILNPESHFENGHFLHSTQYYFAKRYFQNSDNCDKLAILLANKIKNLKLTNITLVGFRNYTGLLLNKTTELLRSAGHKIDYAIVEPLDGNGFTWQFIPDFSNINTNFVIVLPITCTCSTYLRIRSYLLRQIHSYLNDAFPESRRRVKGEWSVRRNFFNIFLIQDTRLKKQTEPVYVSKPKTGYKSNSGSTALDIIRAELSELYSGFNWERIDLDKISFYNHKRREDPYVAYPLVKLYSDLVLPEKCGNCFPEADLVMEKNMFLTHDNFETPNLIQDFPSSGKEREEKGLPASYIKHKSTDITFSKLFPSNRLNRPSLYYGHIRVNGSRYMNYIRGNTFFDQNKSEILNFFHNILSDITTEKQKNGPIAKIVFITAENKHNSTFLDEIINYKKFGEENAWQNIVYMEEISGVPPEKQVKTIKPIAISILRIDPQNEFIDNFMSNYFESLDRRNTLLIYFEEVFSSGKTFKLISNYIKHYKNLYRQQKELVHGFDYAFTLIDRMPFHTREEILKKLYSYHSREPQGRLIRFFQLNVPIVSAAHLGNPLEKDVRLIVQMVEESHIDALKKGIGNELHAKMPAKLPEESMEKEAGVKLRYFPFEDEKGRVTEDLFEKHKGILESGKMGLLKLYIAHEINAILAGNKKWGNEITELEKYAVKDEFIPHIITEITKKIKANGETFFTVQPLTANSNLGAQEVEMIHDTVLKILSRHPFTYYSKIYESIFRYCLVQMEKLRADICNDPGVPVFATLRKLKFYIRRLVDLDSSYLISHEFILLMQHLYEYTYENNKNRIEKVLIGLEESYNDEIKKNIEYPYDAIIDEMENGEIGKREVVDIDKLKFLHRLRFCLSRLKKLNLEDRITAYHMSVVKKLPIMHKAFKGDSNLYNIDHLLVVIQEEIKKTTQKIVEKYEDDSINITTFKEIQQLYKSIFQDAKANNPDITRLADDDYQAGINVLLIQPFKKLIEQLKEIQTENNQSSDFSILDLCCKLKFYLARLSAFGITEAISPDEMSLLKYKLRLDSFVQDNDIHHLLNAIQARIKDVSRETSEEWNADNIDIRDMRINNLIHKYNSVDFLQTFIICSYKESVFRNHYRSIKLEELINQTRHLPEIVGGAGNDPGTLMQQVKDPYYHITGIIKSENIFPISKLKELHKEKYRLFRKKREGIAKLPESERSKELANHISEWMDPESTDSIKNYYFGAEEKSDPIIINAIKFLNNSRFALNKEKLENMKLSVARMLCSVTKLMEKTENKDGFLKSIESAIESIVSILKPGIDDLEYALVIKYSNTTNNNDASKNIYVISSDEATYGNQIDSNGLIFKLMNGLFTSAEKQFIDPAQKAIIQNLHGEQSLLTGVKTNGRWTSFNENYFESSIEKATGKQILDSVSFHDLFKYDIKETADGEGLSFLKDANMSLLFRLSELKLAELEEGKCELEGKAVLIVTSKKPFTRDNFLNFMSNEKVRLLLLIKDELLTFLNTITNNSTFYELIKQENLKAYQSDLKHGLENYFLYQKLIIDDEIKDPNPNRVINILINAVKGQIGAYNLNSNQVNKVYKKEEILENIRGILETARIEQKSVSSHKITFDNNSEYKFDSFIYEIVLTELLINAKRHSPRVDAGIEVAVNANSIKIKNKIRKIDYSSDAKRQKKGKKMCYEICERIGNYYLEELPKSEDVYGITIYKENQTE